MNGTYNATTMTKSGAVCNYVANVGGIPLSRFIANITPIQSGTGDPSPSNPRPITGWAAVNVARTGKNLFDIGWLVATGITFNDNEAVGTAHSYNTAFGPNAQGLKNKISFKPNNQYSLTVSAYNEGNTSTTGNGLLIAFKYTDGTETRLDFSNSVTSYLTQTITSNSSKTIDYVSISFASAGSNIWHVKNIQIEISSSPSAYQPYTGQTATINLGDTYYGGNLNVGTGLLTVTHQIVDLSTFTLGTLGDVYIWYKLFDNIKLPASNSEIGEVIAEQYVPIRYNGVSGTTNTIAIRTNSYMYVNTGDSTAPQGNAVYELATPHTIQLTPTQVTQLLGENNVWADSGDSEVDFFKMVRT